MTALRATSRIRHAVAFSLRHPPGSPQEVRFLAALAALGSIDGVESFEVLREISPKNPYTHGVSMEFADQGAYDAYDAHPEHVAFVRDRWTAGVAAFVEIDFAAPAS